MLEKVILGSYGYIELRALAGLLFGGNKAHSFEYQNQVMLAGQWKVYVASQYCVQESSMSWERI